MINCIIIDWQDNTLSEILCYVLSLCQRDRTYIEREKDVPWWGGSARIAYYKKPKKGYNTPHSNSHSHYISKTHTASLYNIKKKIINYIITDVCTINNIIQYLYKETQNLKSTAVNACPLAGTCPSHLVKFVAFCCFWPLLLFHFILLAVSQGSVVLNNDASSLNFHLAIII